MLKDILGVIEKTNTRPLLITFLGLTMCTFANGIDILAAPTSWETLVLIPFAIFFSYGLVFAWIFLVIDLNARLREGDLASWGPMIGCSILAYALLIVFAYLSSHPNGLSFSILGQPNFIRVGALFLLAAETIKIGR